MFKRMQPVGGSLFLAGLNVLMVRALSSPSQETYHQSPLTLRPILLFCSISFAPCYMSDDYWSMAGLVKLLVCLPTAQIPIPFVLYRLGAKIRANSRFCAS